MFDHIASPNWQNLMPQNTQRVEAPPTTKESSKMDYEQELCAKAERLLGQHDLDAAEDVIEQIESIAKAKYRVTTTHSYDDGKDDNDKQLEDLQYAGHDGPRGSDDSDPDDDEDDDTDESDDSDESDDDEEDDDEPVTKSYEFPFGSSGNASGRSGMYAERGASVFPETGTRGPNVPKFLVRADHIRLRDGVSRTESMRRARKEYPQDHEQFMRFKDRSPSVAKSAGFSPLGDRRHTTHPNRQDYTTSPAVGQPKRTKFDDLVDQIQRRDNCTRTTALSRARSEHPDEYSRFQGWHSSNTTQDQHSRRSVTDAAYKRAPCYEDLVAAEIAKGCTTLVQAQQRVAQMYGNNAIPPSAISKGEDLVEQFNAKVSDLVDETGCDLLETSRYVADTNPTLLKYMRG
jgi:hypothetical protein